MVVVKVPQLVHDMSLLACWLLAIACCCLPLTDLRSSGGDQLVALKSVADVWCSLSIVASPSDGALLGHDCLRRALPAVLLFRSGDFESF